MIFNGWVGDHKTLFLFWATNKEFKKKNRSSSRQLHLDDCSISRFGKTIVAYFRRIYGLHGMVSAPDCKPDPEPLPELPVNLKDKTSAENAQILTDWNPDEETSNEDTEHIADPELEPLALALTELHVKVQHSHDTGQWKIGAVNWDDCELGP